MTRAMRTTAGRLLVLLCAGLCGCNLSRPYPDKTFYAIEAGKPTAAGRPVSPLTLRIYDLLIASPYNQQSFVYKTGASRFESDYYHGFIVAPTGLLTGVLVDWMKGAGLYAVVVGSDSRLADKIILEGNVREMYGDFTDSKNPRAVMTAAFFLIDDTAVDGRVLFQKTYHAESPIAGSASEGMAAGLGAAYREILTQLTQDLAHVEVDLPASTQPA
jgi:ABC-type uncharacterized transport system auxiliary subunit